VPYWLLIIFAFELATGGQQRRASERDGSQQARVGLVPQSLRGHQGAANVREPTGNRLASVEATGKPSTQLCTQPFTIGSRTLSSQIGEERERDEIREGVVDDHR
jgi:hypothetical protein